MNPVKAAWDGYFFVLHHQLTAEPLGVSLGIYSTSQQRCPKGVNGCLNMSLQKWGAPSLACFPASLLSTAGL